MNSVKVWMPLYIGDYLADTIDLTNAEHGAYLRSMMAYWRKGEALSEIELRAICGKEFGRVSQFFTPEGGKWYQKRVEEELSKALDQRERAVEKSKKALLARYGKPKTPNETKETGTHPTVAGE